MSDGSIRAEWNDDGHYRRTTDPEYRVEMVTPKLSYEGYPRLYIKQTLEVRTFDGQRVPVMAYIMNPELHLKPSLPPRDYYLGIKAGYEQNGLPVGCLKYAFKNCLKECGIEPYPKKAQTKPPQRKETGYER